MNLLQQFRQHCAAEQVVQPGDRLLLAVSGGVDSRVMLDLFSQLRDDLNFTFKNSEGKLGLQLAVGHVNHQLRGSESDEDEAFVKALAQKAGLPFYSERVEVSTFARTHKLSLEAAARELRYQALESFRKDWQARAIVTAHTLDDQAETVLDHILRGCGLAGLAGMASCATLPLQNTASSKLEVCATIVRPLLAFSREQLEEYAKAIHLHSNDLLPRSRSAPALNPPLTPLVLTPLPPREYTFASSAY
jgi:tRNA(Ile)-lysidine synthase